ncbi:hypothetical protein ACGFJT_37550 [Actinomadura geliboluensis]|uniref:hypothetical protein n=1 Tax=Actinomadura geliboluensis TaxID=882440 RepID=UPI0037167852
MSFLQMYNHLAEHAEFRRCGNETCGRSFVRQRGHAGYGQNHTPGPAGNSPPPSRPSGPLTPVAWTRRSPSVALAVGRLIGDLDSRLKTVMLGH